MEVHTVNGALLLWYPEQPSISALRHGVAVNVPSVLFTLSGDDIISGQTVSIKSLKDKKMARRSLLEIPRRNIFGITDEIEVVEEEKENDQRLFKIY